MFDRKHSPGPSPSTRRAFLGLAATATLALSWPTPSRARPGNGKLPITGEDNSDLAPFDQLMMSFVEEQKVPGAALAVARNGQLVYARGFGYADVKKREPVQPAALFRIASVSKPFTAVAIVQLVENGSLKLDDRVIDYLKLKPYVAPGSKPDPRWHRITIRNCLQHTGGWDRAKSFDPIGRPWEISKALDVPTPVAPANIVRYMMGQTLDFDPGQRHAYSNLGFLILGRVLETVTGQRYSSYVKKKVLAPLGIQQMRLGRALLENRASGEVSYYDRQSRTGASLYPPRIGQQVPFPDGAENFEGFEAHGGWIASAVELVKFAASFDDYAKCPLLNAASIKKMWSRPNGNPGFEADGKPKPAFYACGWNVRPIGSAGKLNAWHSGFMGGTESLLVRRSDKLCWAVLFNTDNNPEGKSLSGLIDGRVHEAADKVKAWPNSNLFDELLA